MPAPAVYKALPRNPSAVFPPQPAAQVERLPCAHTAQLMYSRIAPVVGSICVIGDAFGVLVGVTPPH